MRPIFFALLFSIISSTASAQASVYHNFPDTNFIWVEWTDFAPAGNCCCGGGVCVNDDSYQLYFGNDTVMNNQTMSSLLKTGSTHVYISGMPLCPPWCNNITSYYIYYTGQAAGFLRADNVVKKVYFIEPNLASETLLYDFNMQVGDSAKGSVGNGTTNFVSAIDSVLVGAQYHKRFVLSTWDGMNPAYAEIVEGVGGSMGLRYPIAPPFEFITDLVCAYENQLPVYPDSQSGCTIPTGLSQECQQLEMSMTMNSETKTLSLYSMHADVSVSIFDATGKQIIIQKMGSTNLQVDVSALSSGLYLVKGESADGKIFAQQFLITK